MHWKTKKMNVEHFMSLKLKKTRMGQFLIKAAFCPELGDVLPRHDCCIVNKPSPAPAPST